MDDGELDHLQTLRVETKQISIYLEEKWVCIQSLIMGDRDFPFNAKQSSSKKIDIADIPKVLTEEPLPWFVEENQSPLLSQFLCTISNIKRTSLMIPESLLELGQAAAKQTAPIIPYCERE